MEWVTGALWLVMLGCLAAGAEEQRWENYTHTAKAALAQNQYTEAEQQFRAALKVATDFAPDDPRLAESFANLAAFYHSQGQYAHAESLYRHLLGLLERVLGPAHPQVADVLEHYATLLRAMYPVRSLWPWSEAAKMTVRAEHIRYPEAASGSASAPAASDPLPPIGRWPVDEQVVFSDP
jgi:tetratricopeptide (TPR) repeat protein